jgi:hypothetical protein
LWIAVLPNGRAVVVKEQYWYRTTAEAIARNIKQNSRWGARGYDLRRSLDVRQIRRLPGLQSVGDIYEMNGIPLTPPKTIAQRLVLLSTNT